MLRRWIMRTRAATDSHCILRVTLPRWTLIVFSVLMVISDDQAPDRTFLLQVLRNQVVVFAALSDLYHDVINLHASKS